MGFVFPTAPMRLRAMLPCVAWPPLAASESQQATRPSRCNGNAKHANPLCPDGKHTAESEEHSKPAPANSLDSASSSASDLLPSLQPALPQSDKTIACGGGDNDHSNYTLQLHQPPTAAQQAFTRSSDFKQPEMSPVTDTTETPKRSSGSMSSTTQWASSEATKGAEPRKSDKNTTHSTDQLPCDFPATASIAAKSPVVVHPVAAGVGEHNDNPFAMFPDCAITTCTKGTSPMPGVPFAAGTTTAALQDQDQLVAVAQDTCCLDYLDTSLSSDPIESILQLLPNDLAMMIQTRLEDGNSSRCAFQPSSIPDIWVSLDDWMSFCRQVYGTLYTLTVCCRTLLLLYTDHDVIICRQERILSDIIVDQGRPVRMRYCRDSNYLVREEEVPAELDISEAIRILSTMHTAQHAGMMC